MKTIVFTAQSFGFGPASKMIAVSESIRDARKVFFGTEVACDLAGLHAFDEIHRFSQNDREQILSLLGKADLFVNVMDFPSGKLAKIAGCPHFLIDSLLWFWPELPEGAREADVYFCQNFFESVKPRIREYGLANARVVGPIVNTRFDRLPAKDQVVVNFGGMECPFIEIGKDSNYPFVILENLLPILKSRFPSILVTGRERVMEMCRSRFAESESLAFRMLDQKRMLAELHRSRALFTPPGIETFYDAFDKLPVFCLPPQTNSNWLGLDGLLAGGAVRHCFHWPEVYGGRNFDRRLADGEEIRMVLEWIRRFEEDRDAHGAFQAKVRNFLDARGTWPDLVRAQKRAVRKLGKNGVEEIADAVRSAIDPEPEYSVWLGRSLY